MKALNTLLKIAKRQLETLRRMMGEEMRKLTDVEGRIAMHAEHLVREQAIARRDYDGARAYGGYAGVALAAGRALEGEKRAIEAEIDRLRGVIAEAHTEVRKFERLLELRDERERMVAQKRANEELDEMATMRAGRAKL